MPRNPAVLASRIVPVALLAAAGLTTATPAHADSGARAANSLEKPSLVAPIQYSTLAAPSGSSYTVKPGDTLSHIAARYGVSVAALQRSNGLGSSTLIRENQRLTIPAGGQSGSGSSTSQSSSGRGAGGAYTVRSGDTLSAIAKANGVGLQSLIAANPGINAHVLQVGQKISLPSGASGASTRSSTSSSNNTFLGRTYPQKTVAAADTNRATLESRSAPSRETMRQLVRSTAQRYGVDPRLAQAIAFQESGFNMRAVSPANAVGTMQVIPSSGEWASQLAGRQLNLLDPQDNVTAGVLVLRANLRAASDEKTAIAAYYQGLGSVRKNGMFSDTVRYVNAVEAHKSRFG